MTLPRHAPPPTDRFVGGCIISSSPHPLDRSFSTTLDRGRLRD
ncbi:hypothetical protein CKA32_006147 [Geitlerinema sp. FC II]|nr:hypothetical protein CKA32_006147 [Geitlerinema sp. FC II]